MNPMIWAQLALGFVFLVLARIWSSRRDVTEEDRVVILLLRLVGCGLVLGCWIWWMTG